MKVSIVTVCFNSAETIRDTILSVARQVYSDIEYIVIDGGSTDGTIEIVASFGNRVNKFVSEPDTGIYNAMNKGLKLATGDVVGILNSDDFFTDERVIQKVANEFSNSTTDAVYGDVQFVKQGNISKVIRYYSSRKFRPARFKFGYMPAHPSFYVRRELFEKLGYYKENYKIGSDFELLVRFLYINNVTYKYLDMPFVTMRIGGVSNKSIFSVFILNKEIARACEENGLKTNMFRIYSKYILKIFEFV
jgi:glycosyltransferase involved in cell wall biosynthesis